MSEGMLALGRIGPQSDKALRDGLENVPDRMTQLQALLVDSHRGRYAEMLERGSMFWASVATVTLPVNAASLASLAFLYNPVGSGKVLELINVEAHFVVAATVVNALGLYTGTLAQIAAGTFTTDSSLTAIRSCRIGASDTPTAKWYTAYTHSGTPFLVDIIGGWGAVTDGGSTPIRKDFNGTRLIMPGGGVSLAMTTGAGTASGFTGGITWGELPLQS